MVENELYERAFVTITGTSREELFSLGRAKLDELFGKDSYRITEVSYNVDGKLVIGEMYAVYLGEPI